MITRRVVGDWLLAYMDQDIEFEALVSWAGRVLKEGHLRPAEEDMLLRVLHYLARLEGRPWGLTWDELCVLTDALGYTLKAYIDEIDEDESRAGDEFADYEESLDDGW